MVYSSKHYNSQCFLIYFGTSFNSWYERYLIFFALSLYCLLIFGRRNTSSGFYFEFAGWSLFFSSFGVDITYKAEYGFWGLVILTNWQLIGYMMVTCVAGLQNVPNDLIEAAQIDGASPLKTLFSVKIPMVMPSVTICMF
ncbi:MAG: ABC transporter permease subunit [Eubacterium sp.]